jgi:fatty-acyl-CoA synthase
MERRALNDGVQRAAFGPEALTPLWFLERSAAVYGDRVAIVDDQRRITYGELAERCWRLAGALADQGIGRGSVVSVLAPNTALALEAHFGVPASGAALNALNIRLSAPELAYIVEHAGAGVVLVDHELEPLARDVVGRLPASVPVIVAGGRTDEYEAWIERARVHKWTVDDEWQLLSINYTSGTTGKPKGVMYAHRGAYLQAMAMAAQAGLDSSTRFLWTLPMFHCNGWCFPGGDGRRGSPHRPAASRTRHHLAADR